MVSFASRMNVSGFSRTRSDGQQTHAPWLPGDEHVEHRQVERVVEHLRETVVLGDAVPRHHRVHEVRDVGVGDHHALGDAGAAGREEQICDVVVGRRRRNTARFGRFQRPRPSDGVIGPASRQRADVLLLRQDDEQRIECDALEHDIELRFGLRIDDERPAVGVLQHPAGAGRRERRVQRARTRVRRRASRECRRMRLPIDARTPRSAAEPPGGVLRASVAPMAAARSPSARVGQRRATDLERRTVRHERGRAKEPGMEKRHVSNRRSCPRPGARLSSRAGTPRSHARRSAAPSPGPATPPAALPRTCGAARCASPRCPP